MTSTTKARRANLDFRKDSKVLWDQTVGSNCNRFGSLLTGSPVSHVGLTSLHGLMYSQATVTTHNIVLEQCSCDQVD